MAGQQFSEWKFAYATSTGVAHLDRGEPCQDYALCSGIGSGVLVAVIADGAGTAKYGGNGARLVCESFLNAIARCLESGQLKELSRSWMINWINNYHTELSEIADGNNSSLRDYAST